MKLFREVYYTKMQLTKTVPFFHEGSIDYSRKVHVVALEVEKEMKKIAIQDTLMLLLLCASLGRDIASGESAAKIEYSNVAVETQRANDTRELLLGADPTRTILGSEYGGEVSADPQNCHDVWYVQDSGSCHCGSDLHGIVKCNPDTKEVEVLSCNCLTTESSHTVAGGCIFNCVNYTAEGGDKIYHSAPTDCASLNRQGTLCGQCLDGYTVPAYSYEFKCIRCDSELENWGLYIVFAFVPLTVFIVIILVFRINVLSPKLYIFVFASQIVTTPGLLKIIVYYISLQKQIHTIFFLGLFTSFYGIWNLDFFRVNVLPDVCINIIPLHILVLDYLVAIYPMLLMAVAYTIVELYGFGFRPLLYMWKPFHYFFARFRRQWGIQTTIMDAFVTFFFLSTTKLLSVSFSLLMDTAIYTPDGNLYSHNLYYDPSIKYFGKEHLPYALMALTILVFFIFLPTSLLLFYQFDIYFKCLAKCQIRRTTLDTFVNAFQKYYKDGSNGTWDCRWFAGFFILMKSIAYIVYSLSPNRKFFFLATMLFTIGGAVVVIVEPYKEEYSVYNIVSANLLLWQALLCASFLYQNVANIVSEGLNDHFITATILCLVPVVYIIGVALLRIIQRFRKTAGRLTSSLPHRLLYPNEYTEI